MRRELFGADAWHHGLTDLRHYGGRHKNIDDAIEAARLLREKLFSHANEGRVALEAG